MKFDLNGIKKGFAKAAIKTKETSGTVVEIAKLKYKLAEINTNIEDNYKKIGKTIYNAAEDADITEEISAICSEISEQIEKRDYMNDSLNDLLNKKQCPECEMKLDKDFEFCPKCGYKFTNNE